MPITALYASLLVPLFVLLCIRVIGQRRAARVAIGHGDDPELLRRMRVQANFVEYVPMSLLLIGLAESLKVAPLVLHGLGLLLLVGRLMHAYGVSQVKENLRWRVAGMGCTITGLNLGAIVCLLAALGFPIRF